MGQQSSTSTIIKVGGMNDVIIDLTADDDDDESEKPSRRENKKPSDALNTLRSENKGLSDALNALRDENKNLRDALATSRGENKSLSAERDRLRHENEQYNDAQEGSAAMVAAYNKASSYDRNTLRDANLKIKGLHRIPVGIARGDAHLHDKFRMLDVTGDGNCGAYALSLIHFALKNKVLTAMQIRNRIITLAKSQIAQEMYQDYVNLTAVRKDGSVRYLELYELCLYCNDLNVNCIVFGRQMQDRLQSYNAFRHVVDPEKPYAIFINTQNGAHYEVAVVHQADHTFALLADADEVEELLAAHMLSHGIPPHDVVPQMWFEEYEAIKDDFEFSEPPQDVGGQQEAREQRAAKRKRGARG